ncbi:hypothetical protein BDN72DRAFT_759041 [Pluteus cervinus]|uniref:Uncharacterized protein n=1 Tax=Pluteus cervinus TaxID=181527 RepID=A0ACD3B991_9AGAR|nr:hypothetical protein BDN72DRAFT_759041 [Pluteus cervinus]
MVGNTFPYVLKDWSDDIALAHASGIDGFALNMGIDDWQPARVADAFNAALQSGLDFKLFLSLDMSSLLCASPQDAQSLRNLVLAHITHPNQLQYNNRAFVSTFSGESCNFGEGSASQGWASQFVNHPDLQGKIYFVPAFFIDPTKFVDFKDVMDGDFNWNSGWPTQVTTSFAQSLVKSQPQVPVVNAKIALANGGASSATSLSASSSISVLEQALSKFVGSTDSDEQHLESLANLTSAKRKRTQDGGDATTKKTYMAAVSPWFFTHYGQDSYNKNVSHP